MGLTWCSKAWTEVKAEIRGQQERTQHLSRQHLHSDRCFINYWLFVLSAFCYFYRHILSPLHCIFHPQRADPAHRTPLQLFCVSPAARCFGCVDRLQRCWRRWPPAASVALRSCVWRGEASSSITDRSSVRFTRTWTALSVCPCPQRRLCTPDVTNVLILIEKVLENVCVCVSSLCFR